MRSIEEKQAAFIAEIGQYAEKEEKYLMNGIVLPTETKNEVETRIRRDFAEYDVRFDYQHVAFEDDPIAINGIEAANKRSYDPGSEMFSIFGKLKAQSK